MALSFQPGVAESKAKEMGELPDIFNVGNTLCTNLIKLYTKVISSLQKNGLRMLCSSVTTHSSAARFFGAWIE